MSTYAERLKDPRWQKLRLKIMDRAGFACESCADESSTLHVHHRLYRKGAMPWEYEDHELICLCENCHKSRHSFKETLDRVMAKLSNDDADHVLGYALGFIAIREYIAIHIPTIPIAYGVADAFAINTPYARQELVSLAASKKFVGPQELDDIKNREDEALQARN